MQIDPGENSSLALLFKFTLLSSTFGHVMFRDTVHYTTFYGIGTHDLREY